MFQRKAPIHPTFVGTKNFGEETIKELEEDASDSASITSSISCFDEETIDYQAVYTLHVFIATVEGQISVIQGEKLMLLDDSNAYWWLVKVVKTSEIGYIPAENIETPYERLARFNKYKNAKMSSFFDPETKCRSHKKVSVAKKVSVQSMIVVTDAYGNPIDKHSQVRMADIDDPLLRKQQGIAKHPPRLSNHMLSLGLTQHFMQTRGARIHPSNRSTTLGVQERINVLRVFAGNISVKATFNSVLVNENTTADQLLLLALERFRLLDAQQQQRCDGVEYYITVQLDGGDEIALSPQDKPLAMFHSLNAHLTTPMPSLTQIRSKVQLTRIGVVSEMNDLDASFGQNSVARFSLNKRIKRVNEKDGHLRIKIAYDDKHSTTSTNTPISTSTSSSRFSRLYHRSEPQHQKAVPSQVSTRIEKLVAVPDRLTVRDLTELALEKFHLQRHTSCTNEADTYDMTLVLQGKEHVLDSNRSIMDTMNDQQFITHIDDISFHLKKVRTARLLSTTVKQATTTDLPLQSSATTKTTMMDDFGNSEISLTSTSSSTSSDSSRSLTTPDSHGIASQQGSKLTTDALLQHINIALSSLEQNQSVVSGAFINASYIGSTHTKQSHR